MRTLNKIKLKRFLTFLFRPETKLSSSLVKDVAIIKEVFT